MKQNPDQAAATLFAKLQSLRLVVAEDSERLMADWRPHIASGEFLRSAQNLACYLSLRRADLRQVQPGLRAFGLSTLGRCEAHVLASLDAVLASLARLAGLAGSSHPPRAAFSAGRAALKRRQLRVFGGDPEGPHTRIMVTLPGEAADQPDLVRDLISKGADCIRINCAHDNALAWSAMIAHTRAAGLALGRDVKVAMDLPGPKIRISAVYAPDKARLFEGDLFAIVIEPARAPRCPEITLSHATLLDHLKPGVQVSIDDGKLAARVEARDDGRAVLVVTRARQKGFRLKPEKGVNLPGADLDIPALTREDIAHLDFVAANADIIGYSFVQTPGDIRGLATELKKRVSGRPMPALMLKIETALAVRNLPRLIVQGGAVMPVTVMIARGDLAVEIGLERLSEVQEEILWLCEAAHVPVVWATQVLENLVKEGMATRAETTDAAMAQRAECVMLNKGPHLVEAVGFLDDILRRMDRHQSKKSARLAPLRSWRGPQPI